MMGLAHRGWELNDYGQHWVHTLRRAGYRSTLIGEQHISRDPAGDRLRRDRQSRLDPAPRTSRR